MTTSFSLSSATELSKNVFKTGIDGLLFIQHNRFDDQRGFYKELSLLPDVNQHLPTPFVVKQLNQARSLPNVIRGIHAEQWNKLVTVTQGVCFSAIVDLRPDSAGFGTVETFLLGTEGDALNGSLYIPAGLGNSLCVVSGPIDYIYAVDQLYRDRDQTYDRAISVFDSELNIPWPIAKDQLICSDRDRNGLSLAEFRAKFGAR